MAYGSRDEGLVLYSKSVCVDGALLYRVTQYLWVLYGPTVGLLYQFTVHTVSQRVSVERWSGA